MVMSLRGLDYKNGLYQWRCQSAQTADQERSKKNHTHKNQNGGQINTTYMDGYPSTNGIEDRFRGIMNKAYNGVERVRVHPR